MKKPFNLMAFCKRYELSPSEIVTLLRIPFKFKITTASEAKNYFELEYFSSKDKDLVYKAWIDLCTTWEEAFEMPSYGELSDMQVEKERSLLKTKLANLTDLNEVWKIYNIYDACPSDETNLIILENCFRLSSTKAELKKVLHVLEDDIDDEKVASDLRIRTIMKLAIHHGYKATHNK